jgi:hypothetical protein
MTDLLPFLANSLWMASCLPAWFRFCRAIADVEHVQRRILKDCLAANQKTDYGRRFDFASISSVDSFQESVPVTTYKDYADSIEATGQGYTNLLTSEPVTMFEVTSGSTSPSKLIPYTPSLRAEFQRAIAAWIVDLFRHSPDLKHGPAYWSITPLIEGRKTTAGGIPIGFEEDSAYLGQWTKSLVDTVLAVPNEVKNIQDMETFRYITLLFLLRQPHLRLISVWHPSFLSLLLAPLSKWWSALLEDIAQGTLSPPGSLDPDLEEVWLQDLSPDPQRAGDLASLHKDDYQSLWPHLGLISCWLDSHAGSYASALQSRFPEVFFQGKGLLATEAIVSFPWMGAEESVLAITSHFFEFLAVDPLTFEPISNWPRLAHQLEKGEIYSVIVTTGGGLYRYHLGDVVQVVAHHDRVPCIRFLGRGDKVSDHFGEKLCEQFVDQVLKDLFREHQLNPTFAMLAPDDGPEGIYYALYLELPPQQRTRDSLARLALDLDRKLGRNFHYEYCRRLGQLAEPAIFQISQGAMAAYIQACQVRGQRLGDIKLPSLQRTGNWRELFTNL